MAYTYEQVFAADPSNPSNVAQNASITIFEPGDGTMTPLAITDPDGQPLANPIPVNANGFGSAFAHATLDRVAWAGGGFTGFFTSYEGMKQVALDAQVAAETAAATAGADAAAVVEATVATVVADAGAAATSAATAATAASDSATSASNSATAAATAAALVNAPADTVIAAVVGGEGATKDALKASFVAQDFSPLAPAKRPPAPIYDIVSTFQTGHGWAAGGSAGSTNYAADTTDFIYGTQSLKGITSGTGGNVNIGKTGMAPMDLTKKSVAVLLKVSDIEKVDGIYALIGHGNFAHFRSVKLATFKGTGNSAIGWSGIYRWYHAELTETNTTTGTPNMAAVTDMRVTVYDKNNGAVTVNVQAFATFTKQTAFPNGVITWTWDDNYLPQFELAQRQAFDPYGIGCNYFVIQDTLGTTAPGSGPRFTLAQAHELEDLHNSEIGGHAYLEANHNLGMTTLTQPELLKEAASLKGWLTNQGFKGRDFFAWPKGMTSPVAAETLSRFFSILRHTGGTYSNIVPDSPLRYQAVNLSSAVPVATYKTYIDYAKAHGVHLIIMGHQVMASGATGDTNVNIADLKEIVAYAQSVGVPSRTFGQVADAMRVAAPAAVNTTTTLTTTQQETFDMMAAKTGTTPWVLGDDFNRADNATGLGTAPSGQVWSNVTGTLAISGKKATASANANSTGLVDVGIADYEVSVDIAATATGGQKGILFVRAIDGLNAIRFGTDGATVTVTRLTAGSSTVLHTFPSLVAEGLNVRLTAKCVGNQLTFTLNGISQTITEAQGQTATKIGLNFTNTLVSADNLRVKTP